MNLADKLTMAKRAIDSISQHEDEDAAVRYAFLDAIANHISAETAAIDARVQARVRAIGGGVAAPWKSPEA